MVAEVLYSRQNAAGDGVANSLRGRLRQLIYPNGIRVLLYG